MALSDITFWSTDKYTAECAKKSSKHPMKRFAEHKKDWKHEKYSDGWPSVKTVDHESMKAKHHDKMVDHHVGKAFDKVKKHAGEADGDWNKKAVQHMKAAKFHSKQAAKKRKAK